MSDQIRIISADSHVTTPKDRVYAHLPSKLRHKVQEPRPRGRRRWEMLAAKPQKAK